jgi:tetratricopeptide (TPR) repeat protein
MELKSKLIELLERALAEERALFARLPEDERARRGEPDRWAPKDVIVHLAGWKERLAANLAAAGRGETPLRNDDYEAVNAREFEDNRDRSWPEVLAKAEEACRHLTEQVEVRSEAELMGTDTLPWQDERPLWRLIAGTGTMHPLGIHLGPLYLELGETKVATELQEETARLLGELDESEDWRGLICYNLACHYAVAGASERAIGELCRALELNPGLTEWSKEDPDLVSIRDRPGYLALYAG